MQWDVCPGLFAGYNPEEKRGLVISEKYSENMLEAKMRFTELFFSFRGPRMYLVRGPNNRSMYIYI